MLYLIFWTEAGELGILRSMDETPNAGEVVHLQNGANLPAVQATVPAAEVLKQILEQMLENERRRIRNEFIRIGSILLAFLLLLMTGGFWIIRDILHQVKEARLMTEHSQDALLSLLAASPRPARAAPGGLHAGPAEHPADIQGSLAELENQNAALNALMETQDGNLKNLLQDILKTRNNEIGKLRARIDAGQPDAMASGAAGLEASFAAPRPPAIKVTLPDQPPINSLTAAAADDLPLRLPIPAP